MRKWINGMNTKFSEWFKLAMPDSFKVKESEKALLQRLDVTGGDLAERVEHRI
jgi:hypothetical protein